MVPLTCINTKEIKTIKKIIGHDDVRNHLHSLGFIEGHHIKILARSSGNLIVKVKESRLAISQEMAKSIVV